jgi:hypothetical protein
MQLKIAALSALFALAAGAAAAEISIMPLRQVLTEDVRTATYRVSNPSRRIVDGRVTWVDLTATETGYVEATPSARQKLSAAPYIKVSPAFFRLEPGASTTITLSLRDGRPPQGERRSHLVIETAAVRTPLRKASSGNLEVDIGVGVSTPVILRAGKGAATARIGDTKLLRTPEGLLELETFVEPTGKFSPYGAIEIQLTEDSGERRLIKRIDNVAAYTDASRRRVNAPLGADELPAGILEVRFVGSAEYEGEVFATRAFEVAPAR